MTNIVGLDGKARDAATPPDAKALLIDQLKRLVRDMEEGTLVIDKFIIVAEVTNPDDRRRVSHPTWDSDLNVEQAVFLLEVAKADIFLMLNA